MVTTLDRLFAQWSLSPSSSIWYQHRRGRKFTAGSRPEGKKMSASPRSTAELRSFTFTLLRVFAELKDVFCAVDSHCEPGCSRLSYCSNFNGRPQQLFRSCNQQSDEDARKAVKLWAAGVISMPSMIFDFDIPIKGTFNYHGNHASCSRGNHNPIDQKCTGLYWLIRKTNIPSKEKMQVR